MNGFLRTNCHGTRYVLPQLVHNVRMRQILTMKGRKISQVANPGLAASSILYVVNKVLIVY